MSICINVLASFASGEMASGLPRLWAKTCQMTELQVQLHTNTMKNWAIAYSFEERSCPPYLCYLALQQWALWLRHAYQKAKSIQSKSIDSLSEKQIIDLRECPMSLRTMILEQQREATLNPTLHVECSDCLDCLYALVCKANTAREGFIDDFLDRCSILSWTSPGEKI